MTSRPPRHCSRQAYTFVELVVAIAVIGILIALLVPAIARVRESANLVACKNNMRQIGVGLANHTGAQGHYPVADSQGIFPQRNPSKTWLVKLLPYVDGNQDAVVPTDAVVKGLLCPSDGLGGATSTIAAGTFSHSNYLAFYGPYCYGAEEPRSAFGYQWGARPEEIRDGESNTMVVGEYLTGVPQSEAPNDVRGVMWIDQPGSSQLFAAVPPNSYASDVLRPGECHDDPERDLPCSETNNDVVESAGARSRHVKGVNVLMGDGSVRFVSNKVDGMAWTAMATISSGEVVNDATAPSLAHGGGNAKAPAYFRDRYLLEMESGADTSELRQKLEQLGGALLQQVDSKSFRLAHVKMTPEMVPAIEKLPGIKSIGKDAVVRTAAQSIPTGIKRIRADVANPPAGDGVNDNFTVGIAIIDTGGDASHPDLNYADVRGFGYPTGFDGQGHGTHCAGTAAARDNNIGVVGVCPGAPLYALKALSDGGSGSTADVVAALAWVQANGDQIKVVNMSLGTDSVVPTMNAAINDTVDAGIVVVVAAGNDSIDVAGTSPGSAEKAIVVTALADYDGLPGGQAPGGGEGADDTMAIFSNYGRAHPQQTVVMAPGVDINSTLPGGTYGLLSGTSMAAPHVTGLMARLLSGEYPDPRIVPLPPVDTPNPVRNASGSIQQPGFQVIQDPPSGEVRTPSQARGDLVSGSTENIPTIYGAADNMPSYPLIRAD